MIYTVTLNPSLDYVMAGESIRAGQVNRVKETRLSAGGKGIAQSVVLNALKVPNRALGLAAGFTGRRLQALLGEIGVEEALCFVPGETRINVKLRAGEETEINAPGPAVTQEEAWPLVERLKSLGTGDIVSFGGSLPPGLPKAFVRDLIQALSPDVRAVVDADGETLALALEARPWLVKPNLEEAAALLGIKNPTEEQAEEITARIQQLGARNVLLSMGADGAAIRTEQGEFARLDAPRGRPQGSTCAGDSMLAGFLAGLSQGRDWFGAFHLAVAAGSATVFAGRIATGTEIRLTETRMKMR